MYGEAQTPLQRVLASGVLAEEQQQELSMWVQQIDPLALSEYLDACGPPSFAQLRSLLWRQPLALPGNPFRLFSRLRVWGGSPQLVVFFIHSMFITQAFSQSTILVFLSNLIAHAVGL